MSWKFLNSTRSSLVDPPGVPRGPKTLSYPSTPLLERPKIVPRENPTGISASLGMILVQPSTSFHSAMIENILINWGKSFFEKSRQNKKKWNICIIEQAWP